MVTERWVRESGRPGPEPDARRLADRGFAAPPVTRQTPHPGARRTPPPGPRSPGQQHQVASDAVRPAPAATTMSQRCHGNSIRWPPMRSDPPRQQQRGATDAARRPRTRPRRPRRPRTLPRRPVGGHWKNPGYAHTKPMIIRSGEGNRRRPQGPGLSRPAIPASASRTPGPFGGKPTRSAGPLAARAPEAARQHPTGPPGSPGPANTKPRFDVGGAGPRRVMKS